MGTNVSKQTIDQVSEIVNSTVAKATNEVVRKNKNSAKGNAIVKIDIGEGALTCGFNITATASAHMEVLSQMTAEQNNDLMTQIMNTVAQTAEQLSEQENEGLNIGQTNVSVQINNIKSSVKNKVLMEANNFFKTFDYQIVQGRAQITQSFGAYSKQDCSRGGNTFTAEAQVKLINDNIADIVQSNILETLVSNEVVQKASNTSYQKNKGLTLDFMLGFLLILLLFAGGAYLMKDILKDNIIILIGLVMVVVGIIFIFSFYTSNNNKCYEECEKEQKKSVKTKETDDGKTKIDEEQYEEKTIEKTCNKDCGRTEDGGKWKRTLGIVLLVLGLIITAIAAFLRKKKTANLPR